VGGNIARKTEVRRVNSKSTVDTLITREVNERGLKKGGKRWGWYDKLLAFKIVEMTLRAPIHIKYTRSRGNGDGEESWHES